MRRRIRDVVGVLGLAAIVGLLAGCGQRAPVPPPGLDDTQLAGWQAYVDLKCASCHGENREGKRSGPPLTELAEHWSADELLSYLADPEAVVKATPRLALKAERYAISMPAVSGKAPGYAEKATPETLRAIAEFMLVDPE